MFPDSAKKKKKRNAQQFTDMDLRLLFKCGVYLMQAWFNIIVKAFLLEPDLMSSVGFDLLFVLFSSMTNVKRTQLCYSCKLIHLYNDHVSNLNKLNVWNDKVHKQNVRPRYQHKNMIFIKLTSSNHWLNLFKIRWTTNQWPKQRTNYIFCFDFVLHWYYFWEGEG